MIAVFFYPLTRNQCFCIEDIQV